MNPLEEKFKSLTTLTIVNMILQGIILIAFFLLPWISVSAYISSTAGSLPLSLTNIINSLYSNLSYYGLGSSIGDIQNYTTILLIYAWSWYLIPVFIVVSVYSFYTGMIKHFNEKYNKSVRISYIVNIIVCLILYFIRWYVINQVSSSVNSYFGGYDYGLVSSAAKEVVKLGLGFYIILIFSIVGFFMPAILKATGLDQRKPKISTVPAPKLEEKSAPELEKVEETVKPKESPTISNFTETAGNVTEKALDNIVGGFNKIKKKSLDYFSEANEKIKQKSRNSEDTGNLLPAILLQGEPESIEIFNLPAVIGRNKSDVDYYIFDNTISREHLDIGLYGEQVVIKDRNSTHGTFLNGERLEPGEVYSLFEGDNIRLGNLEFLVLYDQPLLKRLIDLNNSEY